MDRVNNNRTLWFTLGAMAMTVFFAVAGVSCEQKPVYGGVPGYPVPALSQSH